MAHVGRSKQSEFWEVSILFYIELDMKIDYSMKYANCEQFLV